MAGELRFSIEVDDNGTPVIKKFTGSLDDMKSSTDSATGGLSNLGGMSIIVANQLLDLAEKVYSAANRIYEFADQMATMGKEIQRSSQIVGMSTTLFQEWQYAAELSGGSAEQMVNGMKFLSRAMMQAQQDAGKGGEAFKALGISVTDSSGKMRPLDQMLSEIADKFAATADGPNKIAIALALFGRAGINMIPILDQGRDALEKFKNEALEMHAIIGPNSVKILADSEEAFRRWSAVWKVSKAEFWTPIVQAMTQILDTILKIKVGLTSLDWSKAFEGIKTISGWMSKAQGGLPAWLLVPKEESVKAQVEALEPAGWVKEWVKAAPEKPALPAMEKEATKTKIEEAKSHMDQMLSVIDEGIKAQNNAMKVGEAENEALWAKGLESETEYINQKHDLKAADFMYAVDAIEKEINVTKAGYEKMLAQAKPLDRAKIMDEETKAMTKLREARAAKQADFDVNEITRGKDLWTAQLKEEEAALKTWLDDETRFYDQSISLMDNFTKMAQDKLKSDLSMRLISQTNYVNTEHDLTASNVSYTIDQLMKKGDAIQYAYEQEVALAGANQTKIIELTKAYNASMTKLFTDLDKQKTETQKNENDRTAQLWTNYDNLTKQSLDYRKKVADLVGTLRQQNDIQDAIDSRLMYEAVSLYPELTSEITSYYSALKSLRDMQSAPFENVGGLVSYGTIQATNAAVKDMAKQIQDVVPKVVDTMASSFSTMFDGIISGTKRASDAFKDFGKSVVSSFTKMISDMIAQYMRTETLKGFSSLWSGISSWLSPAPSLGATGTAGGGGPGANVFEAEGGIIPGRMLESSPINTFETGGVAGRLLESYPLRLFQMGGIATTPTMGIFGEGGGSGEAFVPLESGRIPVQLNQGEGGGKGGGGGSLTIINISANDARSFHEKLVREGAGAILQTIYQNARSGGIMKNISRGMTGG